MNSQEIHDEIEREVLVRLVAWIAGIPIDAMRSIAFAHWGADGHRHVGARLRAYEQSTMRAAREAVRRKPKVGDAVRAEVEALRAAGWKIDAACAEVARLRHREPGTIRAQYYRRSRG
ncbi:hypothetical protein K6V18_16295 [Ralstonia insidiosa]|uniref:hypothetical protein n=1 Tax=Ralstonia TaxID=48736 RepID=UPI00076EBECC|nr:MULTISPECIES: hypothetical protein [Ralstonia]MBY4706585.1 hypothetical protein [Ralstonia insidiosa]GAQ27629.1 hypothetical protein SAMD00023378_1312 [Ralstonia sp. NT80]